MKNIVEYEMSKVRERLKERGMTLVLSDEAKQFVIEKARNVEGNREAEYGARPLRRAVEMYVEDPLAEELLRGEFQGKTVITVKVAEVGDEKRLEFSASNEVPARKPNWPPPGPDHFSPEEPAREPTAPGLFLFFHSVVNPPHPSSSPDPSGSPSPAIAPAHVETPAVEKRYRILLADRPTADL